MTDDNVNENQKGLLPKISAAEFNEWLAHFVAHNRHPREHLYGDLWDKWFATLARMGVLDFTSPWPPSMNYFMARVANDATMAARLDDYLAERLDQRGSELGVRADERRGQQSQDQQGRNMTRKEQFNAIHDRSEQIRETIENNPGGSMGWLDIVFPRPQQAGPAQTGRDGATEVQFQPSVTPEPSPVSRAPIASSPGEHPADGSGASGGQTVAKPNRAVSRSQGPMTDDNVNENQKDFLPSLSAAELNEWMAHLIAHIAPHRYEHLSDDEWDKWFATLARMGVLDCTSPWPPSITEFWDRVVNDDTMAARLDDYLAERLDQRGSELGVRADERRGQHSQYLTRTDRSAILARSEQIRETIEYDLGEHRGLDIYFLRPQQAGPAQTGRDGATEVQFQPSVTPEPSPVSRAPIASSPGEHPADGSGASGGQTVAKPNRGVSRKSQEAAAPVAKPEPAANRKARRDSGGRRGRNGNNNPPTQQRVGPPQR